MLEDFKQVSNGMEIQNYIDFGKPKSSGQLLALVPW